MQRYLWTNPHVSGASLKTTGGDPHSCQVRGFLRGRYGHMWELSGFLVRRVSKVSQETSVAEKRSQVYYLFGMENFKKNTV